MWYTLPDSNKQYPVTIERVKKIKQLNAQGVIPDELEAVDVTTMKPKEIEPEFVDVVGQITLKSLEKADKKKRHGGNQGQGQGQRQQQNRPQGQGPRPQGPQQQQGPRPPQGQRPNQGPKPGGPQQRPQGPQGPQQQRPQGPRPQGPRPTIEPKKPDTN